MAKENEQSFKVPEELRAENSEFMNKAQRDAIALSNNDINVQEFIKRMNEFCIQNPPEQPVKRQ